MKNKTLHAVVAPIGTLAALLMASCAMGATVTYNYTGDVGSASGIFAGQGSTVTGTISFDDGLLDQDSSTNQDTFRNNLPVSNQSLASGFSATLTIGTVMVSEVIQTPTVLEAELNIVDASNVDRVRFKFSQTLPTDSVF